MGITVTALVVLVFAFVLMGIEQQTITFVNAAITARAQGVLNQYRRVAPIMQ